MQIPLSDLCPRDEKQSLQNHQDKWMGELEWLGFKVFSIILSTTNSSVYLVALTANIFDLY